jgi:hypothetical protein
VLKTYVRNRLYTREPHNRAVLTNMLAEAMR